MPFETSKLYKLIKTSTNDSLLKAFELLDCMSGEEIKLRSEKDRSTYLHHIVNCASHVKDNCGNFIPLIPIIYKLALKDINVNGQNSHGNTCLHLACLKARIEPLCEHLIRIGKW